MLFLCNFHRKSHLKGDKGWKWGVLTFPLGFGIMVLPRTEGGGSDPKEKTPFEAILSPPLSSKSSSGRRKGLGSAGVPL